MGVVLRASLSFALVLGGILSACASHETTSTASGDGTVPGPGVQGAPTGDYPPGPYGYGVGDTFPRISVKGYVGGRAPWVTLDLKDYFDASGAHGVSGIYVTVSAPWCTGCKVEGQELPVLWQNQYKARGAKILTVLLQDAAYEPASEGTVDAWIATYATPYDIAVGDVSTMLPPKSAGSGVALPYNYAINPRTMKVVSIDSGSYFHGDALPGLDVVLANNGR